MEKVTFLVFKSPSKKYSMTCPNPLPVSPVFPVNENDRLIPKRDETRVSVIMSKRGLKNL